MGGVSGLRGSPRLLKQIQKAARITICITDQGIKCGILKAQL